MNAVKLKVCGMTSMQQVAQLADLEVDFSGFIFYDKSPRNVVGKIDPFVLKRFERIQKVGVFVNESKEHILKIVDEYGLNVVQLHGDETPAFCKSLLSDVSVVKAFRIHGDDQLNEVLKCYEEVVDYFLFDTKAQEYGGTGKQFDWAVLERSAISKPYFLSGGIGLNDAEQVQLFTAKNEVYAIDVNSKFEIAPGVKNMELIKQFVLNIK